MVDKPTRGADADSIRKRTPLEQAVAVKTDRKARYEASMPAKGFKRTTIWVREDRLPDVKKFVDHVNSDAV